MPEGQSLVVSPTCSKITKHSTSSGAHIVEVDQKSGSSLSSYSEPNGEVAGVSARDARSVCRVYMWRGAGGATAEEALAVHQHVRGHAVIVPRKLLPWAVSNELRLFKRRDGTAKKSLGLAEEERAVLISHEPSVPHTRRSLCEESQW